MESTFANIYPNALNLFIVTFMAMIGITVVKWLTARYDIIPGLRDLAASI